MDTSVTKMRQGNSCEGGSFGDIVVMLVLNLNPCLLSLIG
jgi:hypothetical protein